MARSARDSQPGPSEIVFGRLHDSARLLLSLSPFPARPYKKPGASFFQGNWSPRNPGPDLSYELIQEKPGLQKPRAQNYTSS